MLLALFGIVCVALLCGADLWSWRYGVAGGRSRCHGRPRGPLVPEVKGDQGEVPGRDGADDGGEQGGQPGGRGEPEPAAERGTGTGGQQSLDLGGWRSGITMKGVLADVMPLPKRSLDRVRSAVGERSLDRLLTAHIVTAGARKRGPEQEDAGALVCILCAWRG